MAQTFDTELEELVGRFARDLADEIRLLILRRLGIEQTPRPSAAERAPLPPRAAPPAPKAASTQNNNKKKAAAALASRVTARAEAPSKGGRPTSQQRNETLEKIVRIVAASPGLSVGEIERQAGISRAAAGSALKTLKEQDRIFMGGTKRFARYATTQAAADQASQNARKNASAG